MSTLNFHLCIRKDVMIDILLLHKCLAICFWQVRFQNVNFQREFCHSVWCVFSTSAKTNNSFYLSFFLLLLILCLLSLCTGLSKSYLKFLCSLFLIPSFQLETMLRDTMLHYEMRSPKLPKLEIVAMGQTSVHLFPYIVYGHQ